MHTKVTSLILGFLSSLLLFSCNPLEKVDEEITEDTISKLVIYKPLSTFRADKRTFCELTYIDKNQDTLFHCLRGKIRFRGNTSLYFDKKSFSLKLDSAFAMEGFPAHRTWIINASYIDKTFLRNKVSYDLFNTYSEDGIAPKISFTEVWINENYHGLYQVTERMDTDRLNIDETDTLAFLFKEPPLYNLPENHAEKFRQLGHYFANNSRFDDYSASAKQEMVDRAYFKQRFPKYGGPDRRDIIYELTHLIHHSPDGIFSDPNQGIPAYFDIKNIVDWHLLLLMTNNNDGVKKNFYLHKAGAGKPFIFVPWDYDHGFGRDGDGEHNAEGFVQWYRTTLLKRLVETNTDRYNEKLINRYQQLKAEGILTKDYIAGQIAENAHLLRPYAYQDAAMWPLEKHKFFKDTDFDKEVQWMTDWLELHIPRVEAFLDTLSLEPLIIQ
ncbi:MAG: CotH kinase family protein [Bacteroidota bacterium]